METDVDATVGIPPAVTDETEAFWAGAAEGRLVVDLCTSCRRETFPPRGRCRFCQSREIEPRTITAPGRVHSFTVNYQRWMPDLEVPYVLAVIEFDDHPDFRVLGRLRGSPPDTVRIGLGVDVGFEPGPGGCAIPSFTTRADAD